jgi:5-methylcytosine-specific restriction endonuclease McrA
MQTIVLTKEFFRSKRISHKDAIADLLSGRAKPVHNNIIFYSLDEWFTYAKCVDTLSDRVIRSVSIVFYVPEYMIFLNSTLPFKSAPYHSRRNVWIRDGKKCAYCGTPLIYEQSTLDHVISTYKGGKDKWDNLVIACKKCNNKKGNKYLQDTNMYLRVTPRKPSWMELLSKHDRFGFV